MLNLAVVFVKTFKFRIVYWNKIIPISKSSKNHDLWLYTILKACLWILLKKYWGVCCKITILKDNAQILWFIGEGIWIKALNFLLAFLQSWEPDHQNQDESLYQNQEVCLFYYYKITSLLIFATKTAIVLKIIELFHCLLL